MERMGATPGTELGGYRVLAPLGQGGMGTVYRAVDGDGVVVALKVLHPHLGADPEARRRLTREVANLQRVRHPGVARVLDAEIDSTEAFLVTELVAGQDLAARVRATGPLDPAALAALAADLHAALAAVHAAEVLHRDLTPGNVMVTDHGAVLIDFGIAQAAEDARVTSTGLVAGTPGYLAPELLAGAEPDEASDWWGWAAVLAFAATGRPPFGTRPLAAVVARVHTAQVDLAGLDPRTAQALRTALAVEPDERGAPRDVVAALRGVADRPLAAQAAATGPPAPTVPPGPPGPPGPPAPPAWQRTGPPAPADGVRTTVVVTDGSTRVLPVGAHPQAGPPGPPPAPPAPTAWTAVAPTQEVAMAEADAEDLDERDEWPDDAPGDGPDGSPEAWDEPGPRRRVGTVLALGLVLTAAGAAWPGPALLVALVIVVLARSVGLDVAAVRARRSRRGAGRADVARAVAGWPWYLARALLGALPAALVAASAVVVVGGVGWWLLDTGRLTLVAPPAGERAGELTGNAAWVVHALLALAVLVGLLVLWFGPMSRTTRVGARWMLAAVAPGPAGAATLVLLALAGTGVLLTLVVLGQDVLWWPLPGPPDLR